MFRLANWLLPAVLITILYTPGAQARQTLDSVLCGQLPHWRDEAANAAERYRDDPVFARERQAYAEEVVEVYAGICGDDDPISALDAIEPGAGDGLKLAQRAAWVDRLPDELSEGMRSWAEERYDTMDEMSAGVPFRDCDANSVVHSMVEMHCQGRAAEAMLPSSIDVVLASLSGGGALIGLARSARLRRAIIAQEAANRTGSVMSIPGFSARGTRAFAQCLERIVYNPDSFHEPKRLLRQTGRGNMLTACQD